MARTAEGSEADSSPAMQGWLAMRGVTDLGSWERHWFVLQHGRLNYQDPEDKSFHLQPSSMATGFGVAAVERCGPGDAAALANSRPWGFVLDVGAPSASGGGSVRRFVYLDPGNADALEAWIGAVGREAGRLSGAGAWGEIEACKASISARDHAESFVRSGGVLSPPCDLSPSRFSQRFPALTSPTNGSTQNGALSPEKLASPLRIANGAASNLSPSSPGAEALTASPSKLRSTSRSYSPRRLPVGYSFEYAELQATNEALQTELGALRAATHAAEEAHCSVAEVTMAEMIAQSRDAGDVTAEQRRLREELEASRAAHAEAQAKLSDASQKLAATTNIDSDQALTLKQEYEQEATTRQELMSELIAEKTHNDATERRLCDIEQQLKDTLEAVGRQREASAKVAVTINSEPIEQNSAQRDFASTSSEAGAPPTDSTAAVANNGNASVSEPTERSLALRDVPSGSSAPAEAGVPFTASTANNGNASVTMSFSLTNVSFQKLSENQKDGIRNSVATKVATASCVDLSAVRVNLYDGSVRVSAEIFVQPTRSAEEVKGIMEGRAGVEAIEQIVEEVKTLPEIYSAVHNGDPSAIVATKQEALVSVPLIREEDDKAGATPQDTDLETRTGLVQHETAGATTAEEEAAAIKIQAISRGQKVRKENLIQKEPAPTNSPLPEPPAPVVPVSAPPAPDHRIQGEPPAPVSPVPARPAPEPSAPKPRAPERAATQPLPTSLETPPPIATTKSDQYKDRKSLIMNDAHRSDAPVKAYPVGKDLIVMHGIVMRLAEQMDSAVVAELQDGERCIVIAHGAISARRLKVSVPEKKMVGWISCETGQGEKLVRLLDAKGAPTDPPQKAAASPRKSLLGFGAKKKDDSSSVGNQDSPPPSAAKPQRRSMFGAIRRNKSSDAASPSPRREETKDENKKDEAEKKPQRKSLFGFGGGKAPTSPAPKVTLPNAAFRLGFEVEIIQNTILRTAEDLLSPQVCELYSGTRCLVLQRGVGNKGRRLKVVILPDRTKEGWLSCSTSAGESLIKSVEGHTLSPAEEKSGWLTKGHPAIGMVAQKAGAEKKVVAYQPDYPMHYKVQTVDRTTIEVITQEHLDELLGRHVELSTGSTPSPRHDNTQPVLLSHRPGTNNFKLQEEEIAEGWKTTGSPLLGKRVRRYFQGVGHDGTIVAWHPEDPLFKVIHDDEDDEDLEQDETAEALKAFDEAYTTYMKAQGGNTPEFGGVASTPNFESGWRYSGHPFIGKKLLLVASAGGKLEVRVTIVAALLDASAGGKPVFRARPEGSTEVIELNVDEADLALQRVEQPNSATSAWRPSTEDLRDDWHTRSGGVPSRGGAILGKRVRRFFEECHVDGTIVAFRTDGDARVVHDDADEEDLSPAEVDAALLAFSAKATAPPTQPQQVTTPPQGASPRNVPHQGASPRNVPQPPKVTTPRLHELVSKVLTPEDHADGWKTTGHELLGNRVRRVFGNQATNATVVAWYPDEDEQEILFRIYHDDDDMEDLTLEEARSAKKLFMESQDNTA